MVFCVYNASKHEKKKCNFLTLIKHTKYYFYETTNVSNKLDISTSQKLTELKHTWSICVI